MTTPATDRFHALDAARAFALLLGIVLHATMSFFLPIPAQDVSQSTTLAVSFYVIHSFRMSLFFLIAGFFAHMAFHRRGLRAFAKDRAKRILVPMTAGWLVLAPITVAILVWGLSRTFPTATATDAAAAPQGFPLTHLWFLYYLCVFYVSAIALRAAFVAGIDRDGALRARLDTVLRAALASTLAPLAFALPLFAVLAFDPAWPVWFGIPTPDTGLRPQLPALAGFGTAFVLGWLVHRQTDLLEIWRRQWAINLALAVALSTLCLVLVGLLPAADPTTIAGAPINRLVYALAYTASVWYWVFGLIGATLRFCANASPARRYLADTSYWFYLVHLPIVFGLQVIMMRWPLHWTLKFPLIVAITLGLLFASYHWLVRPTFIGEILNGRKVPRYAPKPSPHVLPIEEGTTAVAQLLGVTKRFGTTVALDDFSFSAKAGELVAVLGPNGAGKTTALGLWLGTLEPDAGQVRVMGGSPFDVHSRLGVGVMMQDVNLAPMLSAREHIALAASYYRDPLSVAQTVALTGIEAFAGKRYDKLSGGQKRQVQFAIAICGQPKLLFLDEPTVGLDIPAREALWRTIAALRDGGCAIVLTTHYLEEAEVLADRVAVLAEGRLIAEGSVDAMRALILCKRVRAACQVDVEQVRRWPGVVDAMHDAGVVTVTGSDAEEIVRRLFAADPGLRQLEVKQASLAEAFTELTKEVA
ncbi:acyltransferase family protein [Arenimonas oryziterrae]|nr:acyltransferase family protein [Arenimonas oryziterrae]